MSVDTKEEPTLFGHPTALFGLFFAEMWERFSYYGMRALLLFYMIKGFLSMEDNEAYAVYGAYTSLVYATPFIGGMIADKLLGERKAVVLGGLLMAAGHLLMTIQQSTFFFLALGLLIVGNGFFKPNISTIVGSLYPEHSAKRDSGFTLFYMGINLGAAMSPLLCGYVGETYGWHYGFGIATFGMLVGLAVFIAPTKITQMLILGGAVLGALGLVLLPKDPYLMAINAVVGVFLIAAGIASFVALGRGGLPADKGLPRNPEALTEKSFLGIRKDWTVYLGSIAAVPVLALLVSGNRDIRFIPKETIENMVTTLGPLGALAGTFLREVATPAGVVLTVMGVVAFTILTRTALQSSKMERERMYVVLILMFFSMLFWSFFEQAGSSVNNFTDRNVDRVFEQATITKADVGTTMTLTPNQEQLGMTGIDKPFLMDDLQTFKDSQKEGVDWVVTDDQVGMGLGGSEIPASTFQAANPIFILLFAPLFTLAWTYSNRRGWEPSTPVKFGLGLLQLGLGFAALWYGASMADDRGMVALPWLLLGYLLHTTGELCLSPVGLSMVTRLSPAKLVSTVMGAWFLATAFSAYVAGIIATFTGVSHSGDGGGGVPAPIDTIDIYGSVFGQIAIAAIFSSLIMFILSPLLTKWMHEGEDDDEAQEQA